MFTSVHCTLFNVQFMLYYITVYNVQFIEHSYNMMYNQACDKQGDNALHWAAYKGDFDCFTLMLRAGLEPTQLDGYKQNCLHLAVLG